VAPPDRPLARFAEIRAPEKDQLDFTRALSVISEPAEARFEDIPSRDRRCRKRTLAISHWPGTAKLWDGGTSRLLHLGFGGGSVEPGPGTWEGPRRIPDPSESGDAGSLARPRAFRQGFALGLTMAKRDRVAPRWLENAPTLSGRRWEQRNRPEWRRPPGHRDCRCLRGTARSRLRSPRRSGRPSGAGPAA
jgi:hypothetical protein